MPSTHEIDFTVANEKIPEAPGNGPPVDVSAFSYKTMILVANGGTYRVQISNDGANFINLNNAAYGGVHLISTEIFQFAGFVNAQAFPMAIKFIRIVTVTASANATACLVARQP